MDRGRVRLGSDTEAAEFTTRREKEFAPAYIKERAGQPAAQFVSVDTQPAVLICLDLDSKRAVPLSGDVPAQWR